MLSLELSTGVCPHVGCSEGLVLLPTAGLLPTQGAMLPERVLGRGTWSCFWRVLPGVRCRSASPCPAPAPAAPEFPAPAEQVPGRLRLELARCRQAAGVPVRCRERALGGCGDGRWGEDARVMPQAGAAFLLPACRSRARWRGCPLGPQHVSTQNVVSGTGIWGMSPGTSRSPSHPLQLRGLCPRLRWGCRVPWPGCPLSCQPHSPGASFASCWLQGED